MSKLRKAVRNIALLAILKRSFLVQCAFGAVLGYGIAQWSVPAALCVTGVAGIAAVEVRSR